MSDNYERLVRANLNRLYGDLPPDLAANLPAAHVGADGFEFEAFGTVCRIEPQGIRLDGAPEWGVRGVLVSLYALHANPAPCKEAPLKAYKDFPDSMPYTAAFASHTEQILVPHVGRIEERLDRIRERLKSRDADPSFSGDFAFLVSPLPKIVLCYIFYRADEEFPPSVTCLFSANARLFMPMDGLADVGEYMSRTILGLL